jgi:fluoroquinolone transport system permease protein
MNQLIKTSISDFKLVFRDPSLRIFLVIPFLAIVVVNLVLPDLVAEYKGVEEYVPYVLMAATLQMATMFSLIYSMVLIEEKDTKVAKVYGVLPVSKSGFITFRLMIPFVLSTVFTLIILETQPFYNFTIFSSLSVSVLSGLIAPLFALVVTVLSKNKMAGLTWYKLFNLLVVIPLVAFFAPSGYSNLFGVIPTHWIFQSMNDMIIGEQIILNTSIGFVLTIVLLTFLVRRFSKNHFA